MKDTFQTIKALSMGEFKDRGSKFIGYAFPIVKEEDIVQYTEQVRKEHPKARHHCFAWRLGTTGQQWRANDDGEPSGTAGRPILGQIDSFGLTNVLIIVVRYFGGTLLGTSGLIQAYRGAAHEALLVADIVEKIVEEQFEIEFPYAATPDVMLIIKQTGATILSETYGDQNSVFLLSIRKAELDNIKSKMIDWLIKA